MSWITAKGIFVALAILAGIFYFVGAFLAQFGTSTGMTILKDAGYGGINIGISLVVILVIFGILVVVYILSKQSYS